jgi:hypothetical protein
MFNYYYNQNLRKLVLGFGSLFSNLYVTHANPDGGSDLTIRVPITYASQEKFIRRLLEPSSINDGIRVENQLPRLSYIMTSLLPDSTRRRNRNTPLRSPNNGSCLNANIITEEIPVNIGFSLYIYTRHIDDTLQIVEQIMPFFNPEHVINIGLNSAQTDLKIPIVMTSNNISEKYDGDLSSRRVNISSFNFIAKSYIFGPVQNVTQISSIAIEGLTAGINLDF